MDDKTMTKVIAHYMPDACGGKRCPAPEIWAAVVNGDLTASERERLERHAGDCAWCAAERRLAQDFIQKPQAAENPDVTWIVDQVRERTADPANNVVEMRPLSRRILPGLIGLAAAAMLVLAFLPILPLMHTSLEIPGIDDVTRGARIAPLQPAGELAAMPTIMQWSAAEGAVRYRVTLTDVVGEVVWTAYSDGATELAIPAAVRERLHRGVVYNWTVEGLSEAGQTTAQSAEIPFRVQP